MASILTQTGFRYRITDQDRLWAARMVQYEGGGARDAPAVLWSMTQLFTPEGQQSKYGNPRRFRTFTDLIRAYSQPINPIWTAAGSRCRPGGSYAGTEHCSPSRLSRRQQAHTIPWTGINSSVRNTVTAWAEGRLPNPVPRAIEFAAPSVSRNFVSRNPGSRYVMQGGNWFISTPPTQRWPDDLVTINGKGTARGLPRRTRVGISLSVALLLLAGSFGYWTWTRRQTPKRGAR